MLFTSTLPCAASSAPDHVACVCMCVCVVVRLCMCVSMGGGGDNEEALCLFVMTSWLWQKLEKMPGVSERNSSAWRKCEFVSVCVRPWATGVLLGFVNESQTVKDKNKTWPTAIWSRGQAIWLLPAHWCLCVKAMGVRGWGEAHLKRGGDRGRGVEVGKRLQRKREGGPGSCRRGSGVNLACRPGWRF